MTIFLYILSIHNLNLGEWKQWQTESAAIIWECELILVNIGLICAYVYLDWNLSKYFAKQLQPQARRIKVTFVVFSMSYLVRATVWLCYMLEHMEFNYHLVYGFIYFICEIIPISLVLGYHVMAFKDL